MSDRQALIRNLRAHGRGDELDPLLNDKKIPFSQREAIETLQELCMKAATALEEAQGVPREPDEPDGWLVTDPINPSQVFSERPPDTERGCLVPLYAWDRIAAAYAAPAAPTREPLACAHEWREMRSGTDPYRDDECRFCGVAKAEAYEETPATARDEQDARRYRWLREQSHPWGRDKWYSLGTLDAAIDAALAEPKR